MKVLRLFFHVLYYVLFLLVYIAFLCFASLLLDHIDSLGAIMAAIYGVLFLATPVVVAAMMRFSLFKWYIDPIAAAEIPLFLYISMLIKSAARADSYADGFARLNSSLASNGGEGWLFLIGLFVFGLIASFSLARPKEKSISYRLLSKITSVAAPAEE